MELFSQRFDLGNEHFGLDRSSVSFFRLFEGKRNKVEQLKIEERTMSSYNIQEVWVYNLINLSTHVIPMLYRRESSETRLAAEPLRADRIRTERKKCSLRTCAQ